MHCAVCGVETPGNSSDRVCLRCALARALPHAAAAVPGATLLEAYEMVRELGRGAMGVVWLARERALDRLVAVKVIAAGGDPLLAPRLLREGQAVARLSHPHIVAIHALGGSGAGTFLAMDFAEGGNLAARLDGSPLDAQGAAILLAKLAGAVAHAHAAGIVHRDIKPSNVLLSASGEPQLADFGLAGPLEGRGDLTRTGQVVGTPGYLAPELLTGPATGGSGPAADVYGLGALLYFCLTARAPFVADSTAAILHQVIETDPVSPRLLQPGVPRDLETICLKCLGKSPSGRYATATALREDLERYLRDEPIAARPLGRWGKTLRWGRRHPNAAAGIGFAATVVLLLAIGGPLVALRLERSRRAAAEAAATATAITAFFQNDLLAQASPENRPDRELKLRTVLDEAGKKIEGRFADQPLVEASIRETLGETYRQLGVYPAARQHLARARALRQRVLGPEDPLAVNGASALTQLISEMGNYAEAEAFARQVLPVQTRVLGPEHVETLRTLNALGIALRRQEKVAEAEAIYVSLVETRRRVLGADAPDTLVAMANLAATYYEEAKFAEAETLGEEGLGSYERRGAGETPDALMARSNLAAFYRVQGKFAEAEAIDRKNLEIRRRVLGPEHPDVLQEMNNLALVCSEQGKLDEAEGIYRTTLEVRRRVSGPEHPDTLLVMHNLAGALRTQGRGAEAEALFIETLGIEQRVLGPTHSRTMATIRNLSDLYKREGRLSEAEALVRQAGEIATRTLGATHGETLWLRSQLGDVLLREGRFAEADEELRQTLELAAKKATWDEWRRAVTRSRRGAALLGLGNFQEAEPLLLEGEQGLERDGPRMPAQFRDEAARARERLVRLYTATAKPELAAKWRDDPVEPARK